MNKSYFITGIGTGVGKTVFTCALAHQLKKNGKDVNAIKPIISGWDTSDEGMDSFFILKSLGKEINDKNIEETSPWRFAAPLSPNIAADKEGRVIDFNGVVTFCKESMQKNEITLIEGAGGVFVPINDESTIADLIKALDIPIIVVSASYLGAINHTLSTVKACESENIRISAIIVSESRESAGLNETVDTLRKFTNIPVMSIPYVENKSDIWKDIGDLTKLDII